MIERIERFLSDPAGDSFESLALAVFAFQYERIAPYRRLCDERGLTPATVADWRQVPLVPTAAFKRLRLAAAPEVEVFRSSGTGIGTGQEAAAGGEAASGDEGAGGGEMAGGGELAGGRSVHYHPFPELYRRTIEASFPRFCLPGLAGGRVPMLSLVPSRQQLPDSSLSYMIDHVLACYGSPESVVAVGRRGVEAAPARSWAGARQRAGRPVLVLGTSLALAQWLDALDRLELRFRLPPGSAVFETGGFKGRTGEIDPADQLARLQDRLGIPAESVVREYGMAELTSQCYTRALLGGDTDIFVSPHWMRVRILDPETLTELPPGRPGLVALFDLANLGSAAHLLTEDLGVLASPLATADPAGTTESAFRLVGRAAGAELRGCSLAAEELHRAGAEPPTAR